MAGNYRPLDNQVAIVTGANSGIGEGIARCMASSGAAVAINYVANPEAAQKIVKDITGKGGKAIAVQADVSNEEQVQKMFKEVCSALACQVIGPVAPTT